MVTAEIPFRELPFDKQEVYRSLGAGYVPEEYVVQQIDALIAQAALCCRPRYAYRLFPAEGIGPDCITLSGQEFSTGGVITRYLKQAEQFALFVATTGVEFETWLDSIKAKGDIFQEFLADSIGSEIVEAAARVMASQLATRAEQSGRQISNSYSPGYCGWPIGDQQKLFSLLPPQPCRIELHTSNLMTPIKSVSGIIAVGTLVKKMPYGCVICGRKDCYKKRIELIP